MPWYEGLQSRLETIQNRLTPLCADPVEVSVSSPADENDVRAVESELRMSIPAELREFFLQCSSSVKLLWWLSEDSRERMPESLRDVQYGDWGLSLEDLPDLLGIWSSWRPSFANPEPEVEGHPPYEFDDSFPLFRTLVEGDHVVFTWRGPRQGHVYYLSSSSSSLDWYPLERTLNDFMRKWAELGFPGPHQTCIEPFYDFREEKLSCDSPVASQWRRLTALQ